MANVIAVDLGGTNIRAARIDPNGKIVAREKIPTEAAAGMQSVCERIAGLVAKLRTAGTMAVGIGTPGVPDPETGTMRLPAVNIAGSAGFPLTPVLSKAVQLPVKADNDGNLAALGESWKGAGKGESVVLVFTLGTGIGGGCVINGKVFHGNHNMGTEFGHVSIDYRGRQCPCGGQGCVEMYASAAALGRDAREAMRDSLSAGTSLLMKMCHGKIDTVDARMVCEAARQGDALALFLLDQCCLYLACGIGALINSFNPSCVIIGGGMSLAGDALLTRIQLALNRGRAFKPILQDARIKLAELGDDAGLLGAARMALDSVEAK
ncbi:MAG TPA: ROK family protein [Planctomycetota bacterium]|nr:ROK family protein [Planctomycetota bacterium]